MENQTENQNPNPPVSSISQTPPVTPVSNLVNPPIDKPKSKLPILIIGIILFFLIAGSAAGFYVFKQQSSKMVVKPTPIPSPVEVSTKVGTPDPTANPDSIGANWKEYNGEGFSFKYPEKIDNEEINLDIFQDSIRVSNFTLPMPLDKSPYSMVFSLIENTQSLTPTQYIGQLLLSLNLDSSTMKGVARKSITLDKAQGEQISGIPSANGTLEVYVPIKTRLLRIALAPYPEEQNKNSKSKEWEIAYEQILSTFKFTDSTKPPLTDKALNNIHFILPEGWRSEYKNSQLEIVSSDWDEKNPSIFSRSKTGIMVTINNNYEILPKTRDDEYKRLNDEIAGQKTDHPVNNLTKLTISGLPALSFDESWEGYIKKYYIWQGINTWSISINGNSVDNYKKQLDEFLKSITFSK